MTRRPCPSCELAWQVVEDNLLRRHKDEMSALRTSMLCKGCGGTVGDHLAPDQGGCPGRFVIDGVEMIPSGHRDLLRAEVERLRAALVRQDNIDSRLRAEIGNLREHVESKNRLLPSLISEGKQMETERAVAAEREVERLRARVEVLERDINKEEGK